MKRTKFTEGQIVTILKEAEAGSMGSVKVPSISGKQNIAEWLLAR